MGFRIVSVRIFLFLIVKILFLLVKSSLLLGKNKAKGCISESAGY
jgi:hypothetical protein